MEAEGDGAAPCWATYAESGACFPNGPMPPPPPRGWPGSAESVRAQPGRAPGPHPWLQHVVVAQSPGLAGEFALVPGAHAHVARDPVHGPREALEEVSAVVVGSTLFFTEGQRCRSETVSQSRPWSHCPPALLLAPRPPDGWHLRPSQTAREGSWREPAAAGTVSTSPVPTRRGHPFPLGCTPRGLRPPTPYRSRRGSPECCRTGNGCGGPRSICHRSGGRAACSPGRRTGPHPRSSGSSRPKIPSDPSHQPAESAEAQDGEAG